MNIYKVKLGNIKVINDKFVGLKKLKVHKEYKSINLIDKINRYLINNSSQNESK